MSDQIQEDKVRLERLEQLRTLGINPYPSHTGNKNFYRRSKTKPEKNTGTNCRAFNFQRNG